jgi:tRNA threonylcarbamoyladenosine modification (KEOPS) complex Cgi121 subunit
MRRLFPEIDSALIVVSALNSKAYEQLSPLVKKIYDLDLEVSRATRMIINAPEQAIKGIASYKNVAFQLKSEIMRSVANIHNETIRV